jgi:hypothetical protein
LYRYCEKCWYSILLIVLELKILKCEIVNKKEDYIRGEYLLDSFKSDKIIALIYDDIQLEEKCNNLLKMMEENKPDRVYNDIQTWFKHETGKHSFKLFRY